MLIRAGQRHGDYLTFQPKVVELGCGTADITGPLSGVCDVYGFDVNLTALDEAARRFPKMFLGRTPIEITKPFDCDILVLCETLEHLEHPAMVVEDWLPKARFSVISHPLDEALDSDISGGEHSWSFERQDFNAWFAIGGHRLQETIEFKMGKYNMILGWGERA